MAAAQVEDVTKMEADDQQVDDGSGITRGEKKARKLLTKLGLVPVEGIVRCEIRRKKAFPVVINKPLVLMTPGKNPSYFVLGQLKVEDLREEITRQYKLLQQQQTAAAVAAAAQTAEVTEERDGAAATTDKPAATEAVVEEVVDTEGLADQDIELCMSQTGMSKAVCVDALRKYGDVIEAIMHLTS